MAPPDHALTLLHQGDPSFWVQTRSSDSTCASTLRAEISSAITIPSTSTSSPTSSPSPNPLLLTQTQPPKQDPRVLLPLIRAACLTHYELFHHWMHVDERKLIELEMRTSSADGMPGIEERAERELLMRLVEIDGRVMDGAKRIFWVVREVEGEVWKRERGGEGRGCGLGGSE